MLARRGRSRVLHISDLHMLPGHAPSSAGSPSWPSSTRPGGQHRRQPRAPARRAAVVRALGPAARPARRVRLRQQRLLRAQAQEPRALPAAQGPKKRIHGVHCRGGTCAPRSSSTAGWTSPTSAATLDVAGQPIVAAGVDDPHLRRDRYADIAGPADPSAPLRLGVTHSPEPRVLDPFAATATTWCWPATPTAASCASPATAPWSPTASWTAPVPAAPPAGARTRGCTSRPAWAPPPTRPVRFACPPEASLLTLVPRGSGPTKPPQVGPAEPATRPLDFSATRSNLGVWRSLVARFVRVEEVVGSNPATPTSKGRFRRKTRTRASLRCVLWGRHRGPPPVGSAPGPPACAVALVRRFSEWRSVPSSTA